MKLLCTHCKRCKKHCVDSSSNRNFQKKVMINEEVVKTCWKCDREVNKNNATKVK